VVHRELSQDTRFNIYLFNPTLGLHRNYAERMEVHLLRRVVRSGECTVTILYRSLAQLMLGKSQSAEQLIHC